MEHELFEGLRMSKEGGGGKGQVGGVRCVWGVCGGMGVGQCCGWKCLQRRRVPDGRGREGAGEEGQVGRRPGEEQVFG